MVCLIWWRFDDRPTKYHQDFILGCPAVITLTAYVPDRTVDEVPFPEACRRLEEAGAAVVGLNCGRGPAIMMPLLKEIKKVCKVGATAMNIKQQHGCISEKIDVMSYANR